MPPRKSDRTNVLLSYSIYWPLPFAWLFHEVLLCGWTFLWPRSGPPSAWNCPAFSGEQLLGLVHLAAPVDLERRRRPAESGDLDGESHSAQLRPTRATADARRWPCAQSNPCLATHDASRTCRKQMPRGRGATLGQQPVLVQKSKTYRLDLGSQLIHKNPETSCSIMFLFICRLPFTRRWSLMCLSTSLKARFTAELELPVCLQTKQLHW